MNKFLLPIVIVVVIVAALLFMRSRHDQPSPPVAVEPAPTEGQDTSKSPSPPAAETLPPTESIQPVETAEPAEPLPPLDESDSEVREAVVGMFGTEAVKSYLAASEIVRKVVVTVDNLPRDKVAMRVRAVDDMPGRFVVSGPEDGPVLDAGNFVRYRTFVDLVGSMDAVQIAGVYRHFYPLLQQAYEDLGYPGQPFHYRVIECIDDLLDAPEVEAGTRLVRPKVLYQFADPGLESRSAGQKMLMRMGPDNARIVKNKLREVRAALAAPGA